MKGKRRTRIAVVLMLIMASTTLEVNVSAAASKATKVTCNCKYCSLKVKVTGTLREGQKISKKSVAKVLKVTNKGKKCTYSVKQIGETVKGSKCKLTIQKGDVKKKVTVKVNRIKEIYIKQCKLTSLVEGSTFDSAMFKKKSIVMAGYKKGKDKKITTYEVIGNSKKVTANLEGEYIIKVTFGKFEDEIPIPVVNKEPLPDQTAAPTEEPTEKPTATSTVEPTEKPMVTSTVEPTGKPTATSTVEPTGKPMVTSTVEPTGKPTVTSTVEPTGKPTATSTVEPTGKPTATSTVEPTGKPTATSTAEPTVKPTATPTVEPTQTPAVKYCSVEIVGGTITYCDSEITDAGVKAGSYVKIKPDDREHFGGWANKKGNIQSYEETYGFFVNTDMYLEALFANEIISKKPVVHFTGSQYEFIADLMVRFFMSAEIPENYTRSDMGFIYTSKDLDESTLILGSVAKKVEAESSGTGSADWKYDLRFPQVSWDAGTNVKVRVYATVESNGTSETIYSEIISFKLQK